MTFPGNRITDTWPTVEAPIDSALFFDPTLLSVEEANTIFLKVTIEYQHSSNTNIESWFVGKQMVADQQLHCTRLWSAKS